MDYRETVEYLYRCVPMFQNIGAQGYKEGLSNTLALDEHLGHPHRSYRTIHVGGTNGKGSCSHTIAAILQSAGYKVGLYTSPHLVSFRERIRVNGEMVSEDYIVRFVEEHRSFFEPLQLSFFELTTAMAFKYFELQQVDIAVVEVGLGGRLDCTNIITPTLSVITNISFDHTQFLGNTLAAIAAEKAGIIKSGIPVVVGESNDETKPVFVAKVEEVNTTIIFAEENAEVLKTEHDFENATVQYSTKNFGKIQGELTGLCQEKNANTILHAIMQLRQANLNIYDDDVRRGFANVCEMTGLMGRWQLLQDNPRAVCDTGHNEGGFRYIVRQLEQQDCKRLHIVFGMVNDKDISAVLSMLPENAVYYFAKANVHRALDENDLRQRAMHYGLEGNAYPTVIKAYEAALRNAEPDDFIFVGGSSYVVADLLAHLHEPNNI
ncbi:MAG: bifunctional folylpolyglutamate synthase/dihydrofolate synthase [Prevotellaceae bacterium]|nr:bifunctional folylpolyglutamate synthase/dihydrofolate synthase [Prevotellaceae bacterium]